MQARRERLCKVGEVTEVEVACCQKDSPWSCTCQEDKRSEPDPFAEGKGAKVVATLFRIIRSHRLGLCLYTEVHRALQQAGKAVNLAVPAGRHFCPGIRLRASGREAGAVPDPETLAKTWTVLDDRPAEGWPELLS